MSAVDRAMAALEGGPLIRGAVRLDDGQTVRLFVTFRGCDDEAFEIDADLLSVQFLFPVAERKEQQP